MWFKFLLSSCYSYDFYMVVGICSALVCPLLGALTIDPSNEYSQGSDPIIVSSIQSLAYRYTLVVEIAISGQMILDACLHNFSNLSNAFGTKGQKDYMLLLGLMTSRVLIVACTTACLAREYVQGMWSSKAVKFAVVLAITCSTIKIRVYGHHWSSALLLTVIF
eukprot:gene16031-33702_t